MEVSTSPRCSPRRPEDWSQPPPAPGVFRPQMDEPVARSQHGGRPLPFPRPARRAERGLAPTLGGGVFGWRGGQEGGGRGEGVAKPPASYKRAVPSARFLHSQESRSEPGAISKPGRSIRPRGQSPAQSERHPGPGGSRRGAPRADLRVARCLRPRGVPGASGPRSSHPASAGCAAPPTLRFGGKVRVRRLHCSASSRVTPGAPSAAGSP